MLPIFSLTQEEYAQNALKLLGKGKEHASYLYTEWFREGVASDNHPAFSNAKKLYQSLLNITDFSLPSISKRMVDGKTEKFLLKLEDGYETESVVIPMKFGWSLCVSSQVGCRMGCTFCQTGRMGLLRNLKPEEIVAQLYTAKIVLGYDIRNIVFMGMGEPLDNYEAVMKAIRLFTDPAAFGIAKGRITISTSGRIDGIKRLITEADPAIRLAISVNAPNDVIRTKIMPVNRKYNMAALKEVLIEYAAHPKRSLLVEYVLLKGINDSLEDADELAVYLSGLNVRINLIPYNPQNPDRYEPPSKDVLEAFFARMRNHGFRTLLRLTKGSQIMAACGQLGNLEISKISRKQDKLVIATN